MLILPAIDIKCGECVRLYQGDFATAERVAADYMQTALSFKAVGCSWIHMVDLDGSVEKRRINQEVFMDVARNSGLQVALGGGIRCMEDIAFYLDHGISRVIFGSAAVNDPILVEQSIKVFGAEHVAVGIDARQGFAAVNGWREDSSIHYIELAKRMEYLGVSYIIYTDIGRDGMLSGPNLEELCLLRNAVKCNIIASGGVTNLNDIKALKAEGLYGAICGRSIYAGTLSLSDALKVAAE